MATINSDLDRCQRFLHDAGSIWSRTELLEFYQDAYRQLLAQSKAARHFVALPVPPRVTISGTYPWEARHALGGTWRQMTYNGRSSTRQSTALWALESDEGLAATAHYASVTQLWEIAHSRVIDRHYRFALPRNTERVAGIWWDNKRLEPVVVRELDEFDTAWYRQSGEPWLWTPGLGEPKSLEIYEIRTDYQQAYQQTDLYGLPRRFTGNRTYTSETDAGVRWRFAYTSPGEREDGLSGTGLRITTDAVSGRQVMYPWEAEIAAGATTFTAATRLGTYPWEADHGATNVGDLQSGTVRAVSSPDRQYVLTEPWRKALGTVRVWQSSEAALLVWEAVVPDKPQLSEEDEPEMLPAPLSKYLRYYVLFQAFNRQGEGYNPNLAAHWEQRWMRGAALMKKLANVTWADQRLQRQPVAARTRRVPAPQLPSDFPRVGW